MVKRDGGSTSRMLGSSLFCPMLVRRTAMVTISAPDASMAGGLVQVLVLAGADEETGPVLAAGDDERIVMGTDIVRFPLI